MAERQRCIGAIEVWFTRAKREWRAAAGAVGARVWLCPKCDYWPSSDSWLPARSCYNCGEHWASTKDDSEATPITVKVTDYGYELVSIGRSTPGVSGNGHQSSCDQTPTKKDTP